MSGQSCSRYAGRVALVTGAASGIGLATARRLGAEGARVVLTDVDGLACRTAAEAQGGLAIGLDVTDEAQWAGAIETTTAAFGRLDLLVNNAGIGDLRTIEESSRDDFERVVAVMQTGAFLGMRHAGGALKSARGAVVNVSSIFGIIGLPGLAPGYHAAKGALRALSKAMAAAWGPDGVRVNSVHPGFIDTPMLGGADAAMLTAGQPIARVGTPDEVAAAIAFLGGPDATYITGAELAVDGGSLAV